MYILAASLLLVIFGFDNNVRGEYVCTPLGNTCIECDSDCPAVGAYATEMACRTDTVNPCFDPTLLVEAASFQCAGPVGGCIPCGGSPAPCIPDLGTFPTLEECESSPDNQCGPPPLLIAASFQCAGPAGGCIPCGGPSAPCIPDLGTFPTLEECESSPDNQCGPPPLLTAFYQCADAAEGCVECGVSAPCIADLGKFPSMQECQESSDNQCSPGKWQCADPDVGCVPCGVSQPCVTQTFPTHLACYEADNQCVQPPPSASFSQGEEQQTVSLIADTPVRWQCASGGCTKCWSQGTCIQDLAAFKSLAECYSSDDTCTADASAVSFQCMNSNQGCQECGGMDGQPCVADLAMFGSQEECDLGDNYCYPQDEKLTEGETPAVIEGKKKYLCIALGNICDECSNADECSSEFGYDTEEECRNDKESVCYINTEDIVDVSESSESMWQCADPSEGCKECSGSCVPDLAAFDSKEGCEQSDDNECKAPPQSLWQCADPEEGCVVCSGVSDCIPDLGTFDSEEECMSDSSCSA